MLFYLLGFLLIVFVALLVHFKIKTHGMVEHLEKIPGPRLVPILGTFEFFNVKFDDVVKYILDQWEKYNSRIIKIWLGSTCFVTFDDPNYIEKLLSSKTELTKSTVYQLLKPWEGDGLLTSSGERWKTHRKLLEPAFHLKILEQCVEVFNNNANILVDKFSKHLNGPEFEIRQHLTLCSLDNLCETVMGVKVNAQSDSHSEYAEAVDKMAEILFKRVLSPWLYPDFIYNVSPLGREQKKCLEVLHGMSRGVIRMRRKEMEIQSKHKGHSENNFGSKRRLAFLDLLIEKSEDVPSLTDEIIREEVDTFMEAGHDTVATALSFIVWLLSKHQDEQEKAAQELNKIFGDSKRDPTPQDLQNMTYLEKVIKESLRLYPGPLLYGRTLVQDLSLGDYILPGGTNVMIVPYQIHRNPEQYPDPEKFDPERFSPENIAGRHPYAYVPFSLGPRNCIGKKFAMLELKATIAQILRNFKLLPDSNGTEELIFNPNFVLKPRKELRIKIKPRKEQKCVL